VAQEGFLQLEVGLLGDEEEAFGDVEQGGGGVQF
jgi:hypothetical protein